MAACGSFAGLLLSGECDWLTGRTPPKTSFGARLPSGAGGWVRGRGERIIVGLHLTANNSAVVVFSPG